MWTTLSAVRHAACRCAIVLFGLLGTVSNAAEPPATAFERIGADALAGQRAPGFSFAVVHNGVIVFARGFGVSDVQRQAPVRAATPFAIGSLTKQFTAASILLLAQRGKLNIDDTLATYLPAFPNAPAVTLRMLLNQTSGLHNYPFLAEHDWPQRGPIQLQAVIELLAADKPDFAPGTRWAYSNSNYALLAAVIEKAGGVDSATFMQQNIFTPLRMTMSGYGYAAQQRLAPAQPYSGRANFTLESPVSLDLYSGAGGIVSSVTDLARWDSALLNERVLNSASMQMLWKPGALTDGTPVDYAMGFIPVMLAGHREVWHDGLAPGAGGYCYNAIFPNDRLGVVVLSNGAEFVPDAQAIVSRVLSVYDPAVAAQLSAPAAGPPPAAPGEDPAVRARAKDWFMQLQTGTVDLARVESHFAQLLTPEFLARIQASLAGKPSPTGWIYQGSQTAGAATIYRYWINFDGAPHVWNIGLTRDGKIAGSQLQ